MNRVNVYDPETRELVGWFDIDAAEKFEEDTWFDGSNRISKATGTQWDHETLYRAKGGRWVLNKWSQRQGSHETWEFVSDVEAREWLIAQNEDEAVKRYFGELEEERGPGRPEIGPAIQVRLPEDLLAAVDAKAEAENVSRAEMVRTLLAEAISIRRRTVWCSMCAEAFVVPESEIGPSEADPVEWSEKAVDDYLRTIGHGCYKEA